MPCIYVLNPSLADGKPCSKWKNRCYVGVYVGISIVHASNVAMIYNPATGLTSLAYCCLFDTDFTTVSNADPHAAQIENLDGVIQSIIHRHQWHHSDQYSERDPALRTLSQYINKVLLFQPIVKHVYPNMYMATHATEHALLQQKLRHLHADVKRKCKHLYLLKHKSQHKDPASYYEGATYPPDAKRCRTNSQPNDNVDTDDPNSASILTTAVPDSNTPEEQPTAASETSSLSHLYLSPHTGIDLLAKMGFKLQYPRTRPNHN
jgi:hypothetical protein